MEAHELKSLVEAGVYKPDPAQIAAAMLERRGVVELLTGARSAVVESGPSPASPIVRPRAA